MRDMGEQKEPTQETKKEGVSGRRRKARARSRAERGQVNCDQNIDLRLCQDGEGLSVALIRAAPGAR